MRAFPVVLPSGTRYWTVLDGDLRVVPVADSWGRYQRFGRSRAELTTKTNAGGAALYLRWCGATGRDWRKAARDLGLFIVWLKHAPSRADDDGPVVVRSGPGGTPVRREYRRAVEGPLDFAGAPIIHVRDTESNELIDVTASEESLFWEWATVEVLRHTGIRIEELVELSQLSVRQYQRPNGEVIALLVIAPSKTDRERVIPMSAELFHVIAAIIRRLTRNGRKIPLLSRYDQHEKTWSAPMPFLFQRQRGGTLAVISPQRVLKLLSRRCEALAGQHVGFQGLVFTPHDFRRLFATELVNSGLPIHIGAALLGHLNLQTTRGYVTIFNEDIVRHYQEFLLRRRALRPQEEYRSATGEEWGEFEEHFDKRKVELGSCGRPYGTPCAHEHACIRCPMLQISPKMIPRLDEIGIDLQQRRERAEREGWPGEIEGIDLTISFLQAKRIEGLRSQRLGQHVDLSLPNPAAARRD
ncbi:tyrosine-type recombinase/integrase [Streptomyces europaeiscabiei]|uniref:tyrosine-type recombinase/integrase n=1 Tax=Streptomyces europaeiscabiei TaxID=146819 RepID=UPI0038F6C83F